MCLCCTIYVDKKNLSLFDLNTIYMALNSIPCIIKTKFANNFKHIIFIEAINKIKKMTKFCNICPSKLLVCLQCFQHYQKHQN